MDWSKVRLKDFFSLARYKSVTASMLRFFLDKLEGEDTKLEEVHVIEQYMFRLLQCPQCVKAGACQHCGCSIPEKMWVRHDHCSNYQWGPFMTKENWEKHKQTYNLKFKVEYDKI